jgi:hypothetical protein
MSDILALDRHKLQTQFKDAEAAFAHLSALPCDSVEARAAFESLMNKAHTTSKELVAERVALTVPLKTQVAEIEEPFRPVIKVLDSLKELCRSKVSQYDTAVALAAEVSRNLAIAAAQDGRTEDCVLALAAVPDEIPSSFEWVFMMSHADLVPRELCEPSPGKIKALAKSLQNSETAPMTPGGRWERRAVVRAKGK